jgi:hypothetical protein
VLDIQKQYGIAEAMVGPLGKDLVHNCYMLIADKLDEIVYPDTYFYRIMMNEIKSGRFGIMQNGIHKDAIVFRICGDVEWTEEHARMYEQSKYYERDPEKVNKILEDLSKEGFSEEVNLFRLNISGQNISELNRKTGVCRRLIKECIDFVRATVYERYADSDY